MRTYLVAVFVLLGGACDGEAAACDTPEPTLSDLHEKVFFPSCALSSSCHTGGNAAPVFPGPSREDGSLDLTNPEDLCDSIDRAAISDEEYRPLIVCGDAGASYFLIKVDPQREDEITTSDELADTGAQGSVMPRRSQPLCEAKLSALREWIEAGCPGC